MKTALFILLLTANAFAGTACMYNSQCPNPLVCVTDESGRGLCEKQGGDTVSTMQLNSPCTFPSDCGAGLLCARPHGYLDYGKCVPDVHHALEADRE